jgi:hypothetical protein
MKRLMQIILLTFLSFISIWLFLKTTHYDRYVYRQWLYACFLEKLNTNTKQFFKMPNQPLKQVNVSTITQSPFVKKKCDKIHQIAIQGMEIGFAIICFFLSCIGFVLFRPNKEKTMVDEVKKPDYVKQQAKRKGYMTDLWLGKEKFPISFKEQMPCILLHGASGTGKSRTIQSCLKQIRARNDRAIICDIDGDLVRHTYQPKKDRLMNPLDNRSVNWELWKECRCRSDFARMAATQIPFAQFPSNDLNVLAARMLFVAIATRLKKITKFPNVFSLLRYLLIADGQTLHRLLSGTEAEQFISNEKLISIRTILSNCMKSLGYTVSKKVNQKNNGFSMHDWLQNKNDSSWLFLSSAGDTNRALVPLLTTWLDMVLNDSYNIDHLKKRRTWIIIDELDLLQPLPSLVQALSDRKKTRLGFIIVVQNYFQLVSLYGDSVAQTIINSSHARCFFRHSEPSVAAWSTRQLGAVPFQNQKSSPKTIHGPDIMRLDNLVCFIRLAGNWPITQIHVL